MKRLLPFAIIAGVLVVVLLGAVASIRSRRARTDTPFAGQSPIGVQPQSSSPVSPDIALPTSAETSTAQSVSSPPTVPANISVTVEEFGDYQCPPCGQLHPELKKILQDYGARVIFVFRNFPLTTMHKNAQVAAQAAEAARLQGHFQEMHDRLYEHQADWKDENDPRPVFAKYAKALGLDVARFARDMESKEVQERIAFDTQTGMARDVTGTPTIFVEANQLKPEMTTADGIRQGINLMLSHKAARR